jgi:hypothetical protein
MTSKNKSKPKAEEKERKKKNNSDEEEDFLPDLEGEEGEDNNNSFAS